MNKLGKHLRDKRLNLALTQIELGKKIGVTNVTISRIESGVHIGPATIRKLSEFLNIATQNIRALMLFKEETE